MSSTLIGKVLDNYRILERLGIGGMGVVFKAIHIKLEKIFAIKIIAPGLAMNEHFIKRFQTEAKALAKFEDPNIVRIYDLRSTDDQWFIVMEYVDGSTLTEKIKNDGAFHWKDALPVIKQILGAIGHAHEAGVIHRDMKPNNIMLTDDGLVKITDFGLAKDQTKSGNTLSVTSGGTLYYMSPEHVKGFSFIDARSDLYSIGMTFYEMITGIVPFQNINSDFDIRESIVRKDFEKPGSVNPTIPVELEAIVMKSICKNPDDRYQTADDMIQDIHNFEVQYGLSDSDEVTIRGRDTSRVNFSKKSVRSAESEGATDKGKKPVQKKKLPLRQVAGVVVVFAAILFLLFKYYPDFSTPATHPKIDQNLSSLSISSKPASAMIMINDDSIGQTPLKSHMLAPGQYSLKIIKDNYISIDTTISLVQGNDLGLVFVMPTVEKVRTPVQSELQPKATAFKDEINRAPQSASLVVNSNPPNSQVWLNGKLRGSTPLNLTQIDPGIYRMEIQNDGYHKYTEHIKLVAGNKEKINAPLIPFTGGLSVTKDPALATLLLDGKQIAGNNGSVIKLSNIPVGKHRVEIAHPGFSSFTEDVEIVPDEIYTINAHLVRLEGELSIQVRPWGTVYINDEMQKASADIKYKVKLPVEQYDVKVVHPTLGVWRKKVAIQPAENTDILVNFTREISLRIMAVDEQGNQISGEIVVDGKNTGQIIPTEIKVRVGVHKLEVKMDGYFTEGGEKEVLIDQDSDKYLTFTLKKFN
jgi:serine/threonine protein kinase